MKQFRLSKSVNVLIFLLIVLTFSLAPPMTARAQSQKVAILPFTVNAEKDLAYIKKGIYQMLSSRLAWKNKITIVPEKIILAQIHNAPQLSGDALMKAVAENTAVQYIISGSITEFAGTFSLDTKVYSSPLPHAPVQTFSSLADTVDNIIPAMNSIAAEINQRIFDRQSLDLSEAGAGKNSHQEDLTRANPETLIPQVPTQMKAKEKSFWMFWKKGEAPSYPDEKSLQQRQPIPPLPLEELDDEVNDIENVPFWKFWKKSTPQDMDDEMDLEIPQSLD
ncbi:MAG: hypothetical protein QM498_13490 [Desulfobacterium sp.]